MAYVKLSYEEPYSYPRSRVPLSSAPPINLAIDDVRQLQDDHAMIESSLAKLREELDGSSASADVLEILERMRVASARTTEHSQGMWELVPITQRATTRTAIVAEKVFDTPELLEEILTYLKLNEVVTAMRVKKAWCNTVKGSVKLKRWLGLTTPVGGFFHCAFLKPGCDESPHRAWYTLPNRQLYVWLPKFMIFQKAGLWSDSRCWHPEFISTTRLQEYKEHINTLEIRIISKPSVGREPGVRVANTPICYPSVHQLTYEIFCGCGSRCESTGELMLSSNNAKGLTVGDVTRHTNEILRETGHVTRACIFVQIYYTARVELLDNDPITLQRRKAIEAYEQGPDIGSGDPLCFLRYGSDSTTASSSTISSGDDLDMEDVDQGSVSGDEDSWQRASEKEWENANCYFRAKAFPYDDSDSDDWW
ncbi:hypothetical protein CB0940_03948 [Cercospora beticola]|uniref:F-box domain-containing protein n=1 Tax=Cercospora beticola TaxID=122368 RepID=A0A2G5HLY6_CERBT|nr:hypothetical protein CB0940_03948 [Cercospora beticola]PIA93576.1 hypothetical protein CB0940_03948 [Cercospora beticola]WPB01151.1 hypothetical protein RHO25_005772 [Cercospora beticola]CAK1364097.1 unnamed protein product [Cercospora beticola]